MEGETERVKDEKEEEEEEEEEKEEQIHIRCPTLPTEMMSTGYINLLIFGYCFKAYLTTLL